MKLLFASLLLFFSTLKAQQIEGVQLFNPQTNDETPVIGFDENLVLKFDDFSNGSNVYRYTIKHFDRNWQDDGLFFTEYANGSLNALLDDFQYSFNTLQKYTHYNLSFPNDRMQPKISGNFKLIVYKDNEDEPLFTKRFSIVEKGASLALQVSRFSDARMPEKNQRIEVQAVSTGANLNANIPSMTLNILQNNNWETGIFNKKVSTSLGSQILFQQLELSFPGNNEFYYFDNKNITRGFDAVAGGEVFEGQNYTYLHPAFAYPLNYQYQPDVNGAYYFRRSDLGIERNADTEADYSWVHFYLDSDPVEQKIYVLGLFNNYKADEKSEMKYDGEQKRYVAKIYLKQGFYNYILATRKGDEALNFGEINGNFWQTENLYQAFLYYRPFGRNFDGLLGYGEFRKEVR
ncbi:type IX secretion system plug protein [Frigoriflavimonas asaccharolytica]|uniref:Type 9 secretion system plug protein N-terminal domain-containing protein n=1 Tax=Frigoriflavimonas asaccharolytica TaxID=2735899 RepID=A0A8J8G7Y6_9FLAO|nr:type IX secretion system plug protein domain-containing protein [Frigoriflavimonas asaccharolytica]NRS92979.1 hypothetical protein [Frigoriflavimonas asaccharolytica]